MRTSVFALVLFAAALVSAGCESTPKSTEERVKGAVSLYKEGVVQFNDGKIELGIHSLRKAAELNPAYGLLRYDLGRMLLVRAVRADIENLKLQDEARTLHQDGKHEEAQRKEEESKALHRSAEADLREAQGHLEYALASDSMSREPNVPYFLAQVSVGLGDYESARDYLKRAMALAQPTGPQRAQLDRQLEMIEKAELQEKRLRDAR